MNKFDFLNLIDDALIIFDFNGQIVFKNKAFCNSFSFSSNINKLKQRFNFDVCALNTDNLPQITPLDLLLSSDENFFCYCTYQKSKDDYLYINLYSVKYGDFLVVVFKDVSSKIRENELTIQNSLLNDKCLSLKDELDKFSKLKQSAQEQALKMAVLNRLSVSIREYSDISSIINSALSEINTLLGSYKTYFLVKQGRLFRKKYTFNGDDLISNTLISFENDVIIPVKENKIAFLPCLKEFSNSKTQLKTGTKRLILPIYNQNTLLGVLMSYTTHKLSVEDNREIFEYITQLLSNALIRSKLIAELNKKNKKLQKAIKDIKDIQLQLINSEKLASVGQLVAGVAHDINTPAASISSNNLVLKKIFSKSVLSENDFNIINEIISIDKNAIERISNIVVSLKRFVRLDESERQQADINKEIDLTLKIINSEIKDNIKIVKNYSQIPPVSCFVNMLNQVFMNLLVNACHSFDKNSINPTITITTKSDDKYLVVIVKDNGSGIPHKNLKQIFNAGFTTKSIGVGTGLGLAICDKIVRLHKGKISVISDPGKGSEFQIQIPFS